MHTRRFATPLLSLPLLAVAFLAHPLPVAAAACDTSDSSLGNGGFELPGVAPDSYTLFDASLVPPWNTTDVANQIEVWGDTFLGVPAFEGTSFAELNANSAGTLYQDVVTAPGTTMTWTLHHRGRDATDVMKVLIGDASVADVLSDTGWDAVSPEISDPETAWGTATGTYVIPAGQTCTRFAFRAVSSGVGIDSYGNLLDGIAFAIAAPPTPAPTPTGAAAPTATTKVKVTIPPTDVLATPADVRGDDGVVATLLGSIAGLAAIVAVGLVRPRGRRRS